LSEISFGAFLIDLFRVARRFNMPVQPQLVLLQKTILNIEGLGRQLYPELDLWETAKPFLEKWMDDQVGPRAAIRTIRRELPNLFTLAPELPGLAHQLMYKLKNDELTFRTRDSEVEALKQQLAFQHRKTTKIISGIGLIVATLILLPQPLTVTMIPVAGWIGLGGGAVLVVAALMARPK
jgi:ubiquinone biosynthesis protein